jgi:hypothetical protein
LLSPGGDTDAGCNFVRRHQLNFGGKPRNNLIHSAPQHSTITDGKIGNNSQELGLGANWKLHSEEKLRTSIYIYITVWITNDNRNPDLDTIRFFPVLGGQHHDH